MSFEEPAVENFRGLDMNKLGIDEAYVIVEKSVDESIYLRNEDCFGCPYVVGTQISYYIRIDLWKALSYIRPGYDTLRILRK